MEFSHEGTNIRITNITENKANDLKVFMGKKMVVISGRPFTVADFNNDDQMQAFFVFIGKDPVQGLRVMRTDFSEIYINYQLAPNDFAFRIRDLNSYNNFLKMCYAIDHNGFMDNIGTMNYFTREEPVHFDIEDLEDPDFVLPIPILQKWNCHIEQNFSCNETNKLADFFRIFLMELTTEELIEIASNFNLWDRRRVYFLVKNRLHKRHIITSLNDDLTKHVVQFL